MRERQLNNNGTFGDAGCVHMFGGNGGKIQGRELVGIAPGMHPGEIGLRGEIAGRNVDGEGLALKNGVRSNGSCGWKRRCSAAERRICLPMRRS